MDMFTAMRSFVLAVDAGSLAAAARAQGLTPSAVSKHVGGLEDELGVRLLQRTTRKLALTHEGALFYEEAVELLARFDSISDRLGERSRLAGGTLRVTAPVVLGEHLLAPALPRWLARHPEVEVELLLTDRLVDLVAERVDVAVRVGALADSSLIATRLADNAFRACASPDYLSARGTPATPRELAEHDCLGTLHWQPGRRWRFGQGRTLDEVVEVRGPLRSNNLRVLHEAALAGRGVAILPAYLVDGDLAAGRLVELFAGRLLSPGDIHAVYPSRRRLPARVTAFVEFLRDCCGA